ncbi:hypothetical protein CDL12_11739 [Handroanthus impetiginosus]|uniref:TCP domain-containing protein n=1 Tax=Handroanthus impetiginosus TaxID=429701 RepID=A0A2G9HDK7_9LAMI|nr:hypothetical protein CDL12_11739 [Handroanthus impetiginosus]
MYSPSKQLHTAEDDDQPEDGDNPTRKNAVIKELMQENSNLASPKSKSKKRKAEVIEVHGGRIIHSAPKRDRHSKVSTAKGPRDRRVRLSPKTAIQFYDVQDRLGYDRPSKAIDWLIKEAKSAIDALDKQPLFAANASENLQTHDYLDYENSAFGFGFFLDGSPSRNRYKAENAIFQPNYEQGFCSALTTNSQELNTNWEMVEFQGNFTCHCAGENSAGGGPPYSSSNSLPVHSPAEPVYQREPLQSSIINYSPISTCLSGFDFSDELSNITAAAGSKEDKSVFRRQFSAAPFLHYEN